MLRDNFSLTVRSSVSYPPSVTHLPFDHLAQICRHRGCATDFPRLSKHELAFTSLCSCRLPYLPYLSQGWAKIHRSHSHSTPHPGAQRQSSSRLALSASQNCNLSTNPLPVSHADCQLNLFSTSSDHWNRVTGSTTAVQDVPYL